MTKANMTRRRIVRGVATDAVLAAESATRSLVDAACAKTFKILVLVHGTFCTGRVGRRVSDIALISLLVLVTSDLRPLAAETAPGDLVLVQQGSLPIILTAPHGGHEKIAGIAPREEKLSASAKWGGFQSSGDHNTDILVQGIAAEIKALLGKDVYLVMAKFDRKFIDANRPPDLAFDNAVARPFYDYYHTSIRRFIVEVRKRYPSALLIDVHGQKKDPAALMRGTQNGLTVGRLLRRAGQKAIVGPNGLFGQLEANGFKVFPDNNIPVNGTGENGGFNGGYTVFIYGSQNAEGVDTFQLEFGSKYRQKDSLDRTAKDAAKSIVAFYHAYLKRGGK